MNQASRDDKVFYWQAAAFIAVALGIYARFIGLNTWSLSLDEYFLVKSTDYILARGLPEYECGGYYVRGLLMQYIIAAERLLGIPPHLAPRLVSATSYFISLPAIFVICRRLSGNILAYASIILFSLSAWEIEFARFGRMYALFQSVFLWYLVFLLKAVVDDCRSSRYSMYLLTLISLFLWEGAIFLAMLNFIPAGMDYKKVKWQDWVISGVIFAALYIFLTTNFRYMDQVSPMPLGVQSDLVENIKNHSFAYEINKIIWFTLALIPLGISAWGAINIGKTKQLSWLIKAYLFSIIILSLLHLFGVIIYLSLIFLLYDPINYTKAITLKWKLILATTLTSLVLWAAYFSVSPEFTSVLANESKAIFIIKLIKSLFGFPNIFNSFIYKWLQVMPAFFITFILSFIFFIYLTIKDKKVNFDVRFLSIIIISLIYIVGLLDTLYNQTRYLFFIYPTVLILLVYFLEYSLLRTWAKKYIPSTLAISVIAIMLISKDWDTNHIFHVDDYNINFRTIYSNKYNLTKHYYPRRDKEDPAEFVNKNKGSNDIVIIAEIPLSYYLDKTDYVYRDYDHKEFRNISCNQGKLERWSNTPLIYKENYLYTLIENTKGYVWLILLERRKFPDQISIREKYKDSIAYRSTDNEYIVYRIPGGKL